MNRHISMPYIYVREDKAFTNAMHGIIKPVLLKCCITCIRRMQQSMLYHAMHESAYLYAICISEIVRHSEMPSEA